MRVKKYVYMTNFLGRRYANIFKREGKGRGVCTIAYGSVEGYFKVTLFVAPQKCAPMNPKGRKGPIATSRMNSKTLDGWRTQRCLLQTPLKIKKEKMANGWYNGQTETCNLTKRPCGGMTHQIFTHILLEIFPYKILMVVRGQKLCILQMVSTMVSTGRDITYISLCI